MAIRLFDLNIEEVLENWETEHAIREIIANSLDEQAITKTADITIYKSDSGDWHIRDFGRGLKIEHFTLNENKEKLEAQSGVIGKFGAGLKDALATFHRRRVNVIIRSSVGTFSLKEECKHGFSDIITLHVEYDDTKNSMDGTDFILSGVADETMAKAKSFFMRFSEEEVLETTMYGQILRRHGDAARIYIMGVLANEEPNFLFSYNISSLTDAMKKRLNRERLNVGRTTYADRVKVILKSAQTKPVQDLLIEQVQMRANGSQCDEMYWIEISQMALNLLNQQNQVAYFTEQQAISHPDIVGHATADGFKVVVISEQQHEKLQEQFLSGGPKVRTMDQYVSEFNESFQFKFVELNELTKQEHLVYNCTDKILSLIGFSSRQVPPIRVSETMRIDTDDVGGIWDPATKTIIIKRDKLSSITDYAGVLLHEVAHAVTGKDDVTREFESVLTDYLGLTSAVAIDVITGFNQQDASASENVEAIDSPGPNDGAVTSHDKDLGSDPQDIYDWNNKGVDFYKGQKYEDAIVCFNKVLELEPQDAFPWFVKGSALVGLKRYKEAVLCFDRALELESHIALIWVFNGVALEALKRYKDAIVSYEKALELEPQNANALDGKARDLYKLEHHEDTIPSCNIVPEIDPQNADTWNMKGDIFNNHQRYDDAIVCYNKSLEIDTQNAIVWNSKGQSLYLLERYEEAIACYDKAIEVEPHNAVFWDNKSYSLFCLGRYEDSIVCYDRGLEINPGNADLWNDKGYRLFWLERYEDAIACCNRALEINPHNADYWENKGKNLENLKRDEDAAACYDKADKLKRGVPEL